ncbi:MAG TPA: PaaI family thioesterase [Polyangiaceae bacterium]|jgi:uncharacterized protein (TIGR00369 family)|nr:PaaI family thioesterase [Polyangiaceae bacterium]
MADAPPSERGPKSVEQAAPVDPAVQRSVLESAVGYVPHNRALGMTFVGQDGGRITVALPYDEKLIGNPVTRVLHGGAITALMDATCGLSVYLKLLEPIPVATLDLRIDYLRPATPDQPVHARAECFKLTRNVAFVRCEAFHPAAESDLVAVANGTFIVSRGRPADAAKPRIK